MEGGAVTNVIIKLLLCLGLVSPYYLWSRGLDINPDLLVDYIPGMLGVYR